VETGFSEKIMLRSNSTRRLGWNRAGFTSRDLRQYRKSTRWKSETVPHLRPAHHDQRTGRGHFVEVRHHLDLIVAVLKNVCLGIHFVVRVGIHAFVARRRHTAFFVKKFDRFERPSRKRAALEALGIGVPILVHVGAQRGVGAFRNASMLPLPRLEVVDLKA
jgi:hypothetical protein